MARRFSSLEQPSVARGLPAVLEVLRAVSGLAAIIVLVAIMAGVALQSDPGDLAPVLPAPAQRLAEPDDILPTAVPASQAAMSVVLYLVETLEQEQIASWGEREMASNAGTGSPDPYHLIIATDGALETALKDIAKHSLKSGRAIHMEVVDLPEAMAR